MRKTVNLSKTRAVSRQKRAKKAVSILKSHFSEDVKVSGELNEEIWSRGAKKPPRKVSVENRDGVLYPAKPVGKTDDSTSSTETAEQEEVSDVSGSSHDYSDIVDNNIGDVKETVEGLEGPDFDALIKAEESGKDRKTLKEWFESQK